MLRCPADIGTAPDASRTLTWFRVVKLLLSIVLLAIGILEALGRLGMLTRPLQADCRRRWVYTGPRPTAPHVRRAR